MITQITTTSAVSAACASNGQGQASKPTNPSSSNDNDTGGNSALFGLIKFLFWNLPLMASFSLLLLSMFVDELWEGPLAELLNSYKVNEYTTYLGTNSQLDHELTYYHRRCDHRDITTHDANDLLVDPNMTLKERQDIAMTHGAVVMKEILSHDTAVQLREYLETRHHQYNNDDLKLPWDELFWDGDGMRLSLGLGPEDTDIVAKAIAEVGANRELKKTLEAIVGDDPAVVEVSTLSTMFDAEPQGIHTDSDYFASSVLYSRSFLHSYTMFISLQDTTSRMGATTICPGTHWCADEDISLLCQCNFEDTDENEEFPIGYCNTFEASSNGQTGLEVGVLQRGDAMMFNQNVWHRGPRNYDLQRQENRVMFIMTFLSRRDFEKGDNRQQGWGTYYYMRHSMWGHLFSDLKTAATGGMDLFRTRIWKAYGLMNSNKKGNLPWLEHWARQMANQMDFFENGLTYAFRDMLRELKGSNMLVGWLFLDDSILQHLFGEDLFDEEDGIGWEEYLDLLIQSAKYQSKRMYLSVAAATVVGYGIITALYYAACWILGKKETRSAAAPRPLRDLSRTVKHLIIGHSLVLGIAFGIRYLVLYKAPLFERIHNKDIFFKPFPPLPKETFVETHFNDDGEPVGEESFVQEKYPVDVLVDKQEAETRDFEMENPSHPYGEYFERELELLEENHKPISDYFSPKLELALDKPKPAVQTAFPERNDVLIGSRFDADFLASMNYVLDYHPGTKEWIHLMKQHTTAIAEHSKDENYLDMVVDTIVSKIQYANGGATLALLSNNGATPRRFLKQDYETGWWLCMTSTEAKLATKQALLALSYPKSVGVPRDHWKQVLSESRFGKRRHTVLAQKWIPQTVEKSLTELLSNESTRNDKAIVSPLPIRKKTTEIATKGLGRTLLPTTGRGLLPKSMVTGKTALSPLAISILPPTHLPFKVHMRHLMKDVVTLKVGDHVLYKGADNDEVFFQATIASIKADTNELEIQPLRMDDVGPEFFDVTIFTNIDFVQFYRPPAQGDSVWAVTFDPDGENTSWKKYRIMFLTPFGQAELTMADDFKEEHAEEYESILNTPIGRDYKQFQLDNDEVPQIRLHQYS